MIVVDTDIAAHGGASIARYEGRVIFVRGALPGEKQVQVQLDNSTSTKKFLTGLATKIGVPNPHRVPPQCPAAVLGAGCCDLDFIDAEGALEYKTQVVLDQLSRIGHIDVDALRTEGRVHAETLDPQRGWRTRLRLGVDDKGQVGQRKRGSRAIIPLTTATCAQLHPVLRDGLIVEIEALARADKIRPHADLVVGIGDDAKLDNLPSSRSIIERTDTQRTPTRGRKRKPIKSKAPRRTVLSGPDQLIRQLQVAGQTLQWSVPADAFWQGHRQATQHFADIIARYIPATSEPGRVAWDLYGGAGVFAGVLRNTVTDGLDANRVTVVDYASDSTHAGRQALPKDVTFVTGDVARNLNSLERGTGVHAVVLDPPRSGAGYKVIKGVAEAGPEHVVHVGCDPAASARDLGYWEQCGYRIKHLTIVDAFGLTHHVEMLAHLVRNC